MSDGSAPCSANLQVPAEACGCCEGVDASTPVRSDNRIGLGAISYRIGQWRDFRASLIAGLSSSEHAALDPLRTRENADFTIGLLDAVACAADVLTFYQERIANESYLRTAVERVSLQEMAKLIGYRLKPGVAAETALAFALEPPKLPPPGLPPDPGAFVTGIPALLTLDAGLRVRSIPGPDEKPQTFETVEAIDARPEWNAMRAVTSVDSLVGNGSTEVWLRGVDTRLARGDWLLFVGAEFDASSGSERWDARRLIAVEPDAANERTRVAWTAPLANVSPIAAPAVQPSVHALRQRASVFGHNAPAWTAMSSEFRTNYLDGATDSGEWPDFDIHHGVLLGSLGSLDSAIAAPSLGLGSAISAPLLGSSSAISAPLLGLDSAISISSLGLSSALSTPSLGLSDALATPSLAAGPTTVSLDNSYPKIVAPGLALLVKPGLSELYKVTQVSERSRAEFAISGKSTVLTVSGDDLSRFSDAVRTLAVYAESEVLARGQAPKTAPVGLASIDVVGDVHALPAGRRLIVKGLRQDNGHPVVHATTVVSASVGAGGSTVLAIDPQLPSLLRRASVVVFGNVAQATHGETVTEVLGGGDAARPHQRFELKRLPLTYRSASNEIGADSQLSVRVGDVEWRELPTLFGAGPNDRVYTLRTDEQGKCWVQFGDGVRGARLPTSVNNVRATYRQGLGQDGNVDAEQLTQLQTRPLGLKSVANPLPASGGSDAEPADQARRSMPLGTRTLGRAVSLLDYEDFALAFAGVAKAQARVLHLGGGPTISITLAGQDGAPIAAGNPIHDGLAQALRDHGDPHVRIALMSFQSSAFRIGLKVKRDPAYERETVLAAVEAALRAQYGFDRRSLGQPVQQSDVIATAHSVAGVVAVDLDLLYGGSAPWFQLFPSRQRRLLASQMRVVGGVARPAELLTLHPGPLAKLEEMP